MNSNADDPKDKHEGDVLGLGTSRTDVHIPAKKSRRRPKGIDVRTHATGIGDVPQRSGATGIDMGSGGAGTHVERTADRPADSDRDE